MRAVLLHWERPDSGGSAEAARLVGAAWEGLEGGALWGWPQEDGEVLLRQSAVSPIGSVLLPPALSLALALRGSTVEMGARALVLGSGLLEEIARAVATAAGCRVLRPAAPESDQGTGRDADLVIVATDDSETLRQGVGACRSFGTVFSLGDALRIARFNYYTDLHCRALVLRQVPLRPDPRSEEMEAVASGLPGLERALESVARAPGALKPGPGPRGEAQEGAVRFPLQGWSLLVRREDGTWSDAGSRSTIN